MQAKLEKYADLIVQMGVNPEKGQEVLVISGLDQPDFTRLVVKKLYEKGASRVVVSWEDMPLAKLDQLYRSEESLASLAEWELAKWKWRADALPALLWLDSDDPDGMEGIDEGKRARSQAARYPLIKPFREAMENRHQWCIAGVPGTAWAKKVFPGETKNKAYNMLWDAILETVYVTKDNNPEEAWQQHNADLKARTKYLTEKKFDYLEYKSSNGTDFKASRIPESHWCGGGENTLSGNFFNPNLPTEEVFISPKNSTSSRYMFCLNA